MSCYWQPELLWRNGDLCDLACGVGLESWLVSSCLNSPARSFCLLLQYQSLLCAAVVEAQVTAAEFSSSWTGIRRYSHIRPHKNRCLYSSSCLWLVLSNLWHSGVASLFWKKKKQQQKTDDYTKCHKPLTSESSPCVALHPSAAAKSLLKHSLFPNSQMPQTFILCQSRDFMYTLFDFDLWLFFDWHL